MSEWEAFIAEKAKLEGKSEEDFTREMSYQAEMWHNLKSNEVHSLTRKQLDEMYADMITGDQLDHSETEMDEPSKLIWAWNKEAGLPRRGHLDDTV